MGTFALKFEAEIPANLDRVESEFYEHFDGMISRSFGRLIVSVYVDGHANGPMAVKYAVENLYKTLGLKVLRIDRDLVDAAEIARRIDRSRESVRLIISGERRKGEKFPSPCATPNGKQLWEWPVVNEWLRRNIAEVADEEFGLTRDEMTAADNWILRCRTLSREQHLTADFTEVTLGVFEVKQSSSSRQRAFPNSVTGAWVKSWNTQPYSQVSHPVRSTSE